MRKRNIKGRIKNTCSKCKNFLEPERLNRYRYCRVCHREYTRCHRKKYHELSESDKEKSNARAYLHVYVKRGKVKKENCLICGSEKSEAHHKDYKKPLDVIWLCRTHHLSLHEEMENVKNK